MLGLDCVQQWPSVGDFIHRVSADLRKGGGGGGQGIKLAGGFVWGLGFRV